MKTYTSETLCKPKKPFNIKLPKSFQKHFRKPYDKFLISLLNHSTLLNAEEIKSSLAYTTGPLIWLVWLNPEDRATFRRLKAQYMPHVTNARYVLALLSINDRLQSLKDPTSESLKSHDPILHSSWPVGTIITNPNASRPQESYKIHGIELLTEL
jgi:hypothetical protein